MRTILDEWLAKSPANRAAFRRAKKELAEEMKAEKKLARLAVLRTAATTPWAVKARGESS